MKILTSGEEDKKFLASVLPRDPLVRVKPMFGNSSAFVNGNMFAGLYGGDIFVRLPEDERTELLKIKGTSILEPVKGRFMKEYVVLPREWKKEPRKIGAWTARAFEWAGKLPPKDKKS